MESGVGPLFTLAPLAILAGIAIFAAYKRFTNEDELRRVTNRMIALAMEFRLFIDEPALVFRTQRELLFENLRLLRLLAPATLIISAPLILLYPQLDALYGFAPLPLNEPAVVSARFDGTLPDDPVLRATSTTLVVETGGVRAFDTREVSWRIRPVATSATSVELMTAAGPVAKRVVTGEGAHYIAPSRASSWITALAHPFEHPLSARGLDAISVTYPRREILGFDWTIWFFGLSSLTAILAVPITRLGKGLTK